MNFIVRLLISAVAVVVTAWLLPRVQVDGFMSAIIVAFILGLVNTFLKPILVILTIPITLITLGLFLLVINALMILLTDYFVSGFNVDGFLWALIFSLIVSFVTSVMNAIAGVGKKKEGDN